MLSPEPCVIVAPRHGRGAAMVNRSPHENEGKELVMATTFSEYAGKRAGNYSVLPKVDVEILPDVHTCAGDYQSNGCGEPVVYDHRSNVWQHADGTRPHFVAPATRCAYCHTEDPAEVRFVQHPYHDATECKRCGGVTGFGIGD